MQIFREDTDRADFVARLAALCGAGHLGVYAWALMPNHFHLLVRRGTHPLFRSMKKLLTGRWPEGCRKMTTRTLLQYSLYRYRNAFHPSEAARPRWAAL